MPSIILDKTHTTEMNRSRNYLILEGITGIGQFSLTIGAFLAGFISCLGGSETLNGSLGVIPAAMGILQIFSSLLRRKASNRSSKINYLNL
jgi:cadmium resistance protein CadD (predicted permease)